MAYREPGAYLTQSLNGAYVTGSTPSLIPVVIGSGATSLTKTVAIIRSATGDVDQLPFSAVTAIVRVGDLRESTNYTVTTDYVLTGGNQIDWSAAGIQPAAGLTYYVTLTYTPADDHYEVKWMGSTEEVVNEYGTDVISGEINKISLAAQLVLQNSSIVGVLKVKKSGATVTAAEYETAMSTYLQFAEDAYRIIPVDLKADINLKVINHIGMMSTPEERKERVTLLGVEHVSTTPSNVIANVGGYATSVENRRVSTFYPDKATMGLSDGNTYTLEAPMIAAYISGLKSRLPVQQALTNQKISAFTKLVGVDMTRAQLNMLAGTGVMVLTQKASGQPINIRHSLTTDMTSTQTKEISITEAGDYVSKYIRSGLSGYIGKYTVNNELITKLKASVGSMFSTLINKGVITTGTISALYQDAANPDTVIAKLRIGTPFPFNYIDIVLYLD